MNGGDLNFTFGLVNSMSKYLTVDESGLNANGKTLKETQTWKVERKQDGSDNIYLKSHNGSYISAAKNGDVSCTVGDPTEENEFQIECSNDGKWAIKSAAYSRYFGGSGSSLRCYENQLSSTLLWTVQLSMHPQINIYNARRRMYAHVSACGEELHMKMETPWGVHCLLFLEFRIKEHGYAIKTSNHKYLSCDGGELVNAYTEECLFTLEFFAGKMAFKSKKTADMYLSTMGQHGKIEGKSKSKVGADELFTLVDSHPQVSLYSKTKGKYVSCRQGFTGELSANQDEAAEKETFQLEITSSGATEFNPETFTEQKVYFRNDQNNFWAESGNEVKAKADSKTDSNAAFTILWSGRTVKLRTPSGKYVGVGGSGKLSCSNDEEKAEEFTLALTNRPLIVLRGKYGFAGMTVSRFASKLQGNKANYDILEMEQKEGAYYLKTQGGKCVVADKETMRLSVADEGSSPFVLKLMNQSRLMLKLDVSGGGYVTGDKTAGYMQATTTEITDDATLSTCLWEY